MPSDDRDRPLYMISVAAELAGVHPQTLRIYESKGIIKPKRTAGNTRMYSQADIDRLELVSQLTDEGINLAGVIRIMDMQQRIEDREAEIERLRKEASVAADRLHELEMRNTITSLAMSGGNVALRRLTEGTDNGEERRDDEAR